MPFDLESEYTSPPTSRQVHTITRIIEVKTGEVVYDHMPSFRRDSDAEALIDKIHRGIYRVEEFISSPQSDIDDDLSDGK